MIEYKYTQGYLGLYLRENPSPRLAGIIPWFNSHGAEYIHGDGNDTRLRFENDEDALIFKLKFGI